MILQIWDNDKFSLDDYLGKIALTMTNIQREGLQNLLQRNTRIKHNAYFLSYFSGTGSVELDLLNLISPAKTPEKCSLKMLPGMGGSASSKKPPPSSLFSQKSVRGWWPCAIEQDGKHVLGVCLSPQHSP